MMGDRKGDLFMSKVNVKKSIFTSLMPNRRLTADGIVGHSDEMNQRIEKNIALNEKKIAMGMKRAQGIQTK